ncbi:MAG: tellurite resistance TerB family protein [Gammaproteobacteria bacterium]|nr:tellurite resistance TerB family protein [Gammaproteobacteria bacterium]
MDAQAFLEQILNSAKDLASQGRNLAEKRLDIPESGPERDATISAMGKGAMAAGALALLLGTGVGRRLTGTALKLGGLAAVGGLAYKAYQNWQAGQGKGQTEPGTPVGKLSGSEAEKRSLLLLKAMIAAAKADGHVDDAEGAKIEDQISKLGLESDILQFLQEEISSPLDVEAIAAGVDSPEAAAEVYLASRLILDVDQAPERAYLDRLVSALKLDPELVSQLDAQVSG